MRGLLVIEQLYHQIVKGAKTQTRRSGGLESVNVILGHGLFDFSPDNYELVRFNTEHAKFWERGNALNEIYCKPRYKVGEVLYLKEPTTLFMGQTLYKFDCDKYGLSKTVNNFQPINIKWSNKLFMPASAARAFVRITDIKCYRLLDISFEDAIKEGVEGMGYHGWKDYLKPNTYELTAIESFFSLFKFANKVKEVDNIWVWAYTFEYLPNYKYDSQ